MSSFKDMVDEVKSKLTGYTLRQDRISYLEGQAEKYLTLAENEERDKSPIYLTPGIQVYTR